MDSKYTKQTSLLLKVLPVVARHKEFALHGGTAINLFHNQLPRLSIDIDLTWLPYSTREVDLDSINNGLEEIKLQLEHVIPGIRVTNSSNQGQDEDRKLYCSLAGAAIKVEVNTINRGTYDMPVLTPLNPKVRSLFGTFCEILIVPSGQLYGGKIVAALDRQHPRDMFDISRLFRTTGYTSAIHKGFIFCLLSSKRPFHEILKPNLIDHSSVLKSQFGGMTDEIFTYDDFESARNLLIEKVNLSLTDDDKELLLSFAKGTPEWNRYNYGNFPGIQWKLQNINRLKTSNWNKYKAQVKQLEDILFT